MNGFDDTYVQEKIDEAGQDNRPGADTGMLGKVKLFDFLFDC